MQSIEQDEDGYLCHYTEKEKEQQAKGAYVLCAVGRCANMDGLFGDGVDLELARGRVVVDEHFATSMPHVYAIGDLIGGAQLAHAASAQGVAVAERLAGKVRSIDVNVIPGCVYTDPEIASAGLTEDEAKEKGIEVETGKFIMSANGRSIITKEERGFIKVVADKESHVILGAQMMCARATDMIGEFVTAITNQMTVSQLLKGMRHIRPTMKGSERRWKSWKRRHPCPSEEKTVRKRDLSDVGKRSKVIWKYTRKMKEEEI